MYDALAGVVEISPSEVAPVCQAGDQSELTCSVTGIFLRWEFSVPGAQMPFTALVSAGGPSGVPPPIPVNSTIFTFSRLSTQPLTSTMTISSVSEGLNGIQVNCVDIESSESAATTIRIIADGGRKFCSFVLKSNSPRSEISSCCMYNIIIIQ